MLSLQRKGGEYLSPVPWMPVHLKDLGYGVGEIWFKLGSEGQLMSICGELELSLLSPKICFFVENCSTIYLLAYMERKKQQNILGGGKTCVGGYGNHREIDEGKYKGCQM